MKGKQMSGFPARQDALKTYFNAWKPICKMEMVPLERAAGRITAKRLYARTTLPVFRTSGCDGIAVSSKRFAEGFPDTSLWRQGIEYDQADTGDDFADCFDAVIPIEEVEIRKDEGVEISRDIPIRSGWNVRPAGDSVQDGELLMEADMPIRPMDLAALAAGGITMVPVKQKPVVAFIPTGTELIPAGMKPKRGENIDTNSLLVGRSLAEMGAEPLIFPIIRDDPEELRYALGEALRAADIIVMNGGTAKGGEDYNFRLLGEQGRIIHHYIAAAPGRPMALAVVKEKPVINLPGPTVAALFGLEWCLREVLAHWLGIPVPAKQQVRCVLEEEITSTPYMAIMCLLEITADRSGNYHAYPLSFMKQSLPAALRANGMFISEIGQKLHKKGDILTVKLLRGSEYIKVEMNEE